MTKENIHDEQIYPLMAQIIAICKEHNIAAIASFHIPTPEDDGLVCTTHLPGDGGEVYQPFARAKSAMSQVERPAMHIKTVNPDSSATLTAYI